MEIAILKAGLTSSLDDSPLLLLDSLSSVPDEEAGRLSAVVRGAARFGGAGAGVERGDARYGTRAGVGRGLRTGPLLLTASGVCGARYGAGLAARSSGSS